MKRLNKPISLLLALLLLLSLCAPAATASGGFSVITVRTAEELVELSRQCSLDSWSRGRTVRLLADLDLSGTDFSPIPTFGGTFDGQGHTISGLTVDSSGSVQGLFRYVQESATVRDLTVEGSVSAGDLVGGIAGENRGTISGCSFRGTVNGTASAGGIAGINYGTVTGCRFEGTLTGEHYAGGIAGQNPGSIVRCTNGGSVNVTEVKSSLEPEDIRLEQINSPENTIVCTDVGGIAGFSSGIIQSCLNSGSVGYPHVGYNVGGIAGRQTGYVDGCANEGLILGRKDVGGIVGQMEPQLTLKYDQTALNLLWGELDALEAMVSDLLSAGNDTVNSLTGQLESLSASAADVKNAVGALADDAAAWVDGGLAQINDLSARAAWVLERMEQITELAPQIIDQLEAASARLTLGLDQTADAALLGAKSMEELAGAAEDLQAACAYARSALEHISLAATALELSLGNPETLEQALTDLFDGLNDLETAFSGIRNSMGVIRTSLDAILLWFSDGLSNALDDPLSRISDAAGELIALLESAESPEQLAALLPDLLLCLEENISAAKALVDSLRKSLDSAALPEQELETIRSELTALDSHFAAMDDACSIITGALAQLETNPQPELLTEARNEMTRAVSDLEITLVAMGAAMAHLSSAMDALGDAGAQLAGALETFSDAGDALTAAFILLEQAAVELDFMMGELAGMDTIRFDSLENSLSPSADGLNRAADGFFRSVDGLSAAVAAEADELTAHMQGIVGQIGVITDLLQQAAGEQLETDVEDLMEDVSDLAADDSRSTGKISGCTNLGSVEGDVNVAGIVGSMAIEYDFDPEDDLTVSGERTLSVSYLARAVVYRCINRGSVIAKKDHCGGITGLSDLGSVIACEGYGSVTSTAGDCVGGIAGACYGAVRDCWAMCALSGGDSVGGIAGLGTVVTGCRTLVDLVKGVNCLGAVAGQQTEHALFDGNLFVHHRLAGIDGVSYEGKAEPVSYGALCALDGLPEDFTHFTLTFTADGQVVDTVEFRYGDSLDTLPAIPEKAAHSARWPDLNYSFLTFSRTVEAEYIPYSTALSDGEALPQYLVSGSFSDKAEVRVAPYLDGYTVTVTDPVSEVTPFTLHWRLPDEGGCTLLVWNGAAWEERGYTVDGSYLLADCADGSITFRLADRDELPVWVLIAAGAAILIIAAAVIVIAVHIRKKRKAPAAQ